MNKRSVLLLVAAAIVGLVVLSVLGPERERTPRSSESPTDGTEVECRWYVTLGASGSGGSPTVRSVTVGASAEDRGASEIRVYGVVTVSDTTDSVVSYRVSDLTGCASANRSVTVPRDRT